MLFTDRLLGELIETKIITKDGLDLRDWEKKLENYRLHTPMVFPLLEHAILYEVVNQYNRCCHPPEQPQYVFYCYDSVEAFANEILVEVIRQLSDLSLEYFPLKKVDPKAPRRKVDIGVNRGVLKEFVPDVGGAIYMFSKVMPLIEDCAIQSVDFVRHGTAEDSSYEPWRPYSKPLETRPSDEDFIEYSDFHFCEDEWGGYDSEEHDGLLRDKAERLGYPANGCLRHMSRRMEQFMRCWQWREDLHIQYEANEARAKAAETHAATIKSSPAAVAKRVAAERTPPSTPPPGKRQKTLKATSLTSSDSSTDPASPKFPRFTGSALPVTIYTSPESLRGTVVVRKEIPGASESMEEGVEEGTWS